MGHGIETLIGLLDDNDSEVLHAVTDELLKQGIDVIPQLEKAWETALDEGFQERLENVIYFIQFENTRNKLNKWIKEGARDVLEGAVYVSQFQYPQVDYKRLDNIVGEISKDVYLTKGDGLTAIEKVRLLNYVLFDLNNFNRNTANFYSPQNSYINQVIETRKGNPISLGVVYLAVARKIGLPVFGVNLPKSFILAYMDELRYYDSNDAADDVLFYINPYSKGTILTKKEVEFFLNQQKLELKPDYFRPCNNESVIIRLLTNLIIAYQKIGFEEKAQPLQEILREMIKSVRLI